MSETAASLRHKISSATELDSVVRTMKAMAASSIGQYENAVRSLDDYLASVQLGLGACLREHSAVSPAPCRSRAPVLHALVFGSDQGLVGQFNEVLVDFVVEKLRGMPGDKQVWAVGERIISRLEDAGLAPQRCFALPGSIIAVTPLVGQILIALERQREDGAQGGFGESGEFLVFHNQPQAVTVYAPGLTRMLPLDARWRTEMAAHQWPTRNPPELIDGLARALPVFVREYLLVSLFRACAQSLASENASRLAAMQRAERNIDELLENLQRSFHRQRQSAIDEELFDLIAGFEALGARR